MNNPYVKTLEPVWLSTKNIYINEGKLQKLIEDMKQKKKMGWLGIPAWDSPYVEPPTDCSLREWIDFVCTANAINFAFTNFKPPFNKFAIENHSGKRFYGSAAMSASLMRALREGWPIFDARRLADISLEEVEHIFRPIDKEHKIPMIERRGLIFREVGRILIEKYNGSWLNLFESGNWRSFNAGKGIVEQLVANFPSFRDVRFYNGHYLEFYKRAQLLVMIYHGRAFHSNGILPLIGDIEDIGPIADYEVPKALRFFGALAYSQKVKSLVRAHYVFSDKDPIEIESRLAMSYAMTRICDEVGINMAQADYFIWNIGQKSKSPHILVLTTAY